MKFVILVLLNAVLGTNAWAPSLNSERAVSNTALNLVSTMQESVDIYKKPERVVLDELPTLYVYDHCPFCVRVRVVFGLKNIKHKQ